MSASYSALQLGFVPWKIKWCQDSVWGHSANDILEMDDFFEEIDSALPALADRIAQPFESLLEKLLGRMRERHRFVSDQNVGQYLALLHTKDRRIRYLQYLKDEANHMYKEWQKEDFTNLQELLATVVKGERRLEGYYELGSRIGGAPDWVKRDSGPLSEKERAYILAGMKNLPIREQREIEPFVLPTDLGLFVRSKRIQKLGRFLKSHEDKLVAKPHWDGSTITYRGESEKVKGQKGEGKGKKGEGKRSVIVRILDAGQKQEWTDSFKLPVPLNIQTKSVGNAIGYFNKHHKILELSPNGDKVMWGPPGTVKGQPRGIAKRKKGTSV